LPADVPCPVFPAPLSPELVIGVLSRADAVVSMRLHGLVFAAGQGVPIVGISYDPKVSAFLSYIGCVCDLTLDELSAEKLIEMTDTAVRAHEDKTLLSENTNRLIAIEHRNVNAARLLLEK
jgi:polysaccharide pyruvyl transferase WcaK-like protein